MQFGLILPHFSAKGSGERTLQGAVRAEALGFDSVWVRDTAYISPTLQHHGGIAESPFNTEAIVTLAVIGGMTRRLTLGTAVLQPYRHPLKTSQYMASLSYLTGGRVIMGLGLGADPLQFGALGLPFEGRRQRVKETIDICRLTWDGPEVSYQGKLFQFDQVTIDPRPAVPIPIWHGGEGPQTVRFTALHCDGWSPSRVIFPRLEERLALFRKIRAEEGGNRPYQVGSIPLVSVARSEEEALSRFNMPLVLQEAARRSERSDLSLQELRGFILWGTPAQIRQDVARYRDLGVDHLVFDLRCDFDAFAESLELIGQEVIPHFR